MKMSDTVRYARKYARTWGESCKRNVEWTLRQAEEAKGWTGHVARMAERLAAQTDPIEIEAYRSALEHAEKRRASALELSDHQLEQVYVNARRAAHAAIMSLEAK
jgi:hypothetical protein